MRKWILILALALLFNVLQANAEETFYTNNRDRYYHTDPDCDRPPVKDSGYIGYPDTYERAIYKKYPVNREAALEFQKVPCPVCVKSFQPIYLGNCQTEWTFGKEAQPWESVNGDFPRLTIDNKEFRSEVAHTHEAFEDYFAVLLDKKTGGTKLKHDYPSCFAGIYRNLQGSYTYQIVDPTEEILNAFEKMFGGGAWIVSAKYGYNEMAEIIPDMMVAVQTWCDAHPEIQGRTTGGYVDTLNNCVFITLYSEDWQQIAAAMEETAPIYVHFAHEEMQYTVGDF